MPRATLHDYQHQAVAFLQGRPKAGLFLALGLGKTAVALSALRPEDLPALVIAPKRVAEHVWHVEARKWRPDLTVARCVGTPPQRAKLLSSQADVYVVTRDLINEVSNQSGHFRTIILDELSGFKDKSTVRWRNAKRLCTPATNVWGLTATPMPNGLMDLWAQIALLDGGERLGKNLGVYRTRWFREGHRLPNGTVIDWLPRDGAEDAIHAALEDICLYMDADDKLDLPAVAYNPVVFDLPAPVRAKYREFKKELVVDISELMGLKEAVHSAESAGVLTNRLSQLSAGFLYSDDQDGTYNWIHDAKLDALAEVVENAQDNVLVFYAYKPELKRILERFPSAQSATEQGAISAWCRGKLPIMVAHPASVGHGLNLQSGGHTIVWTTLTWSSELFQQAVGRLARQGQTHPVVVHRLEAAHTHDQHIYEVLVDKKAGEKSLLKFLESPI